MATKDYDYITRDQWLFRLQFQKPIDQLSQRQQFDRGLTAVTEILDSFKYLVSPTSLTFKVADLDKREVHERELSNGRVLENSTIIESIRDAAADIKSVRLTQVELTESVRITFKDGVEYVPESRGEDSRVRDVGAGTNTSKSPLKISIGQIKTHMPCRTEVISITGYSDHWLDGDIEKFYLPEATPLAKIDQSRLAASLSNLYDAIEPTELVFDTFENTEGWHTPKQTVPGYESLLARHATEWVLENFEQRQPDEQSFELEFLGDEIHPLITHTQGRSPDEKVQQFLKNAIPKERFSKGATATVYYPDDKAVFVRETRNWWTVDVESNH